MTRISKAQQQINADAALKAEQQAELKRLRAAKAAATRASNKAAKAAVAEHVEAVQPDPAHINIESLFDGIELPSAKRVMVGIVLGVLSAGLTGYGIGVILNYALAGIMVLTGNAFIAFALSVVAWIIAMYATWKISGYIGGKVFASVVLPEGLASRSYQSLSDATASTVQGTKNLASSAKHKVLGMFKRDEVAEFTGAHQS